MLAIFTSHPIQYQAPLWRALAEDGNVPFEVWFLTDHAVKPTHDREFGTSFAWDQDLLEGYPHRFLPIRSGWRMDRFRGISLTESWAQLFKTHGITHLWVEGWRFMENWAAVFAAHRLGIKVWMRGETNDLRVRQGWKESCRKFLLHQLFRRVDQFLYIGTANKRFYESLGVTTSRLSSAPYCVDNDYFRRAALKNLPNRSEIRQVFNIPDDSVCFLFCGKFIEKKRPLDFLEAARRAMEEIKRPLHLLFVGSGELRDEIKVRCRVLLDEGKVLPVNTAKGPSASFTGFLNQGEIMKAYAAADCLVLPSDTGETWGLVVNEAMASGLPCIVSEDCGCAEDLVATAPQSKTYPCGNVQQLSQLMAAFSPVPGSSETLWRHIQQFAPGITVAAALALWEGDRSS